MKASNVFIAKEPLGAGGGNSGVPVPHLAASPTEPPCHVPVLTVSSAGLQMILEMVLLSENISVFASHWSALPSLGAGLLFTVW